MNPGRRHFPAMSSISNDFARFAIINLDPEAPSRGPFIVTQRATDPADPKVILKTWVLAKDRTWLDCALLFAVQGGLAEEVLFDTAAEMVAVIESLAGKAVIRPLAADPKAALARLAEIESSGGLRAAIRRYLAERGRPAL
jgi:hypothetical protein